MKKVKDAEMITYIITHEDKSKKRITVPADWKVTFGPAVKGGNAGQRNGTTGGYMKMPMALRFYESEKKQRAIFTDVVSFRDASIKIEEEITKTQEKEGFTEFDGIRKRTTFQATVKEWVDPDRANDLPALPTDTEIYEINSSDDLPFK